MKRSLLAPSLLACVLLLPFDAASSADRTPAARDVSPNEVTSVLTGRSERKKQSLLDELAQAERLTSEQSQALATVLNEQLAAGDRVSETLLKSVWLIRRMDSSAAAPPLAMALKHADPRVPLLAADAAAIHRPEELQASVAALRQHAGFGRSYAFRRTVVDAVAAYGNGAAVDFLVDLLPQADGQLERVIVLHLMSLTGQDFANRDDRWSTWWETARPDYRGPPAAGPQRPDDQQLAKQWDRPLPNFFEVPLFAKKIVFVIDRSNSMLSTLDGETRLTRAQDELLQAVRDMAPDVEFNIIAFDETLSAWQRNLVPASVGAKANAAQFIGSLVAGNMTASYDALSQSLLCDPNTELIVFLSDGKPTAGTIVDPDTIVQQITLENLFLRATIDTLGIDTTGVAETFMQDLADRNDGQYTRIR